MGVDMVLNPLDITASNILREIQGTSRIITSVLIQGQAELIEVRAQSGMSFIGKPISELSLPDSILIAAIDREGQLIIPDGNTKIKRNDHVIMLSLLSSISGLEKLLKPKR
jgi:trk system potassium uptake protein TrkA